MEDIKELRSLAELRFSQGRFVEALTIFEKVECIAGLSSELANDLAVVHFRLGGIPKALHFFRSALSLQGEAQHRVANNLMAIIEEMNLRCGDILASAQVSYFCPVCNRSDVRFSPLPDMYRQMAREYGFMHFGKGEMTALGTYSCNACGASDRERLYAYWINEEIRIGRLKRGAQVIHFAPEPGLSKALRKCGFRYSTADLGMAGVDHKVDLQSLPFENDSFDFFICSHVLEHVSSDDAAIQELVRITRKGGCGILMAPIIMGLEKTQEDSKVTDPAERWRLYGQDDHVRLYAHDDYVRKLSSHGFQVDQLGIEHFGEQVFSQLGLKPTSILYIARRV